jgi:hypothetical protein
LPALTWPNLQALQQALAAVQGDAEGGDVERVGNEGDKKPEGF